MARLPFFHICYFFLGSCSMSFQSILLSQMEDDISQGVSLGLCTISVGTHFFDVQKDVIITRYQRKTVLEIPKFGLDLKRNIHWTFYSCDLHFLHHIFNCYDKNYLLEVGDYEDAVEAFQIIKEANCWNPNQKFFIYSSAVYENQTAQFLRLITLTHHQMLTNVVIMLPTREKDFNYQIFFWTSRDNEKCVDKPKLPHYFTCRFGNVSALEEKPRHSSDCTLAVKAIALPPFVLYKGTNTQMESSLTPVKKQLLGGLEVELVNFISKSMNINVEYYVSMKEDWGRSFFNGSTTKSMQDLTKSKVDLVIGSLSMSLSRYLLFGSSIAYTEEYLECCVAPIGHIDIWATLLKEASPNAYILICVTYVVLTLLLWAVARSSKNELQLFMRPSIFLYTFSAIIGNSINASPKTRKVRIFFSLLIIFQLFYAAFNQSYLTSVLSAVTFDQEIKTMQDLLQRNMSIYNTQDNHRYFESKQNKIGQEILERWVSCFNTTECLEHVYSNNAAMCLGKTTKDYLHQNNQKKGRPSLYCFHRKLISYPVVMVMRKSLPFREKIDEIIGRTISSGLIKKWKSSMFYDETDILSIPKAFSGILRFSHFGPVVILFTVGLTFAFIVFSSETILCRYKNTRK